MNLQLLGTHIFGTYPLEFAELVWSTWRLLCYCPTSSSHMTKYRHNLSERETSREIQICHKKHCFSKTLSRPQEMNKYYEMHRLIIIRKFN